MQKLSYTGKKWKILNQDNGQDVFGRILSNRKIENKEIFFNPELKHLGDFRKMLGVKEAIAKIKKTIQKRERILIFGDYDADGITSSTILYQTLKSLGAQVSVRLPHRIKHGYGLRKDVFDECQKLDVKLLITVDCGISNFEEVKYGNSLGLETIIIDHHNCPEKLPPAFTIIDPKQKNEVYLEENFAAAGLVFRLSQYLIDNSDLIAENLVLACIGTVADCAPLSGENRIITAGGIEAMQNGSHKIISKLLKTSLVRNKKVNTESIGFFLAPRINAAGRIEDPILAFDLLRGKEENLNLLEKLNTARQEITRESMLEAKEILNKKEKQKVIFLYKDSWHPGVVGLIAGRLAEETSLPTFIACKREDGAIIGSARTPHEFNAARCLAQASEFLDHFGGHHEAAGFSLKEENILKFEDYLNDFSNNLYKDKLPVRILEIDTFLNEEEIKSDLWKFAASLEPCGIGNLNPYFYIKNVDFLESKKIGKDGNHLRARINFGKNKIINAVGWNLGKFLNEKKQGPIDLVVCLRKNEFNGYISDEFEIIDMR